MLNNMSNKDLTPKFLNKIIGIRATGLVINMVTDDDAEFRVPLKRFHIVILVPSMTDARAEDYPDWPNYGLKPSLLYEHSVGDRSQWTAKYDEVARCKALQLWHERNDGGTDIKPHLLFPGDTRYYGGVKRDGIVVACSGVQPWFDRMIAGLIADTCIALAYDGWMRSLEFENKLDFLE